MHIFLSVLAKLEAVPLSAAWLLEEIAEKRGHQDLFTRQSPEQLKRLSCASIRFVTATVAFHVSFCC